MRHHNALLLLLTVPVLSTAVATAEPALAKIEKYERKSVAILAGDRANAFTELYIQSFTDLGRFNYEDLPYAANDPEAFVRDVKTHMAQVSAARSADQQVADKKFNDKVVSGKDLDKIAKAAYVLVPNWSFGKPELGKIEAVDSNDKTFGSLSMSVVIPVELATKVIDVNSAKAIANLKSTQRMATSFTAHYPKGGSSSEANAYLTEVAATLQQHGVLGLQKLLSKDDLSRLVKAQSPDQVFKATEEAQKKAKSDLERMQILSAGIDHPSARLVTQLTSLKELDGKQLSSLHAAQSTADQSGKQSPMGQVLAGVMNPMFGGAMADTIKQARSLDVFLLKAPVSSIDAGNGMVVFDFGNETGVDLDTWFRASYNERDEQGQVQQITRGWTKVRSTGNRSSSAQPIIGGGFELGDQLTELPKTGVNSGLMLGGMYNLTGTTDATRTALGGNFRLDYDLAPTIHRSTGRKMALPEVYGGVDVGMHVFGSGQFMPSVHMGLTGKSYWGQLVGTYGLRLGGYGIPKSISAKSMDFYTFAGAGPELGLSFVLSPDLVLDAGVNSGLYYESETKSILVPIVPRLGASYSF